MHGDVHIGAKCILNNLYYMDLPLHFLCSWRAFSADIIWYHILALNKL